LGCDPNTQPYDDISNDGGSDESYCSDEAALIAQNATGRSMVEQATQRIQNAAAGGGLAGFLQQLQVTIRAAAIGNNPGKPGLAFYNRSFELFGKAAAELSQSEITPTNILPSLARLLALALRSLSARKVPPKCI